MYKEWYSNFSLTRTSVLKVVNHAKARNGNSSSYGQDHTYDYDHDLVQGMDITVQELCPLIFTYVHQQGVQHSNTVVTLYK